MLVTYSGYKRYEKLDTLLACLMQLPESRRPYNYELCLARFHEDAGRTDSAIFHYKTCYDREPTLSGRYEASAGLQRCYLLMEAVETLYPGFLEEIMGQQQGHLHEPLLRTICLLKIGMRPTQIARVMDAKKQTVWSRVKRVEDMCPGLLGANQEGAQ